MSEGPPTEPSPSPAGAVTLTGLAWGVMVVVAVIAAPATGVTLGLALGCALGLGGAGTLAARAVPKPAERRIGLRGFAPRLLLPVLLLVPAVLLSSELDNWIARLFPAAEPAEAAASEPALGLAALELMLFTVLLRPVLEEFFFRGVVQQGVAATLGPARGVVFTAALFGLVRASFGLFDPYRALSSGAQAFLEGLLLGGLRLASGSILPGVLLQMLGGAAGFAALAWKEALPIPGFNTGSGHTPLAWLAPAALSVAAGVGTLVQMSRRRAEGSGHLDERPR
jgi:membrane protease YdiL (CAAX protease family)